MMMLSSLFEIFNPMTMFNYPINWISLILPFMLIFYPYWLIPSRLNMLWLILIKFIYLEFKILLKLNFRLNIIMFMILLIMIFLMNLIGLVPYVFTSTSHMSINLIISMSLWLGYMIYGWMNIPLKMLVHLVPKNTPFMLMNFMVIIEFISNIIRPLTLSIRLTANMIAGHLLMSLLGSFLSGLNYDMLIMGIFIQNLLIILEISVTLIQAYVFSILNLLYFNECK